MPNYEQYVAISQHVLSQQLKVEPFQCRVEIRKQRFDNDKLKDYYPCIEFTQTDIITEYINYVSNKLKRKIRFLDVGAGLGGIMYHVINTYKTRIVCAQADGIECEDIYHKIFEEELKYYFEHNSRSTKYKFYHADAFDFNKYGEYDLIYMYCPIAVSSLLTKLHKHIFNHMKTGAFIVDVGRKIESSITQSPYIIRTKHRRLYRKV